MISELADFSRKSKPSVDNIAGQRTSFFTQNSCVMTFRTSNQISNRCILTSHYCIISLPLFDQLFTRPFIASRVLRVALFIRRSRRKSTTSRFTRVAVFTWKMLPDMGKSRAQANKTTARIVTDPLWMWG